MHALRLLIPPQSVWHRGIHYITEGEICIPPYPALRDKDGASSYII